MTDEQVRSALLDLAEFAVVHLATEADAQQVAEAAAVAGIRDCRVVQVQGWWAVECPAAKEMEPPF